MFGEEKQLYWSLLVWKKVELPAIMAGLEIQQIAAKEKQKGGLELKKFLLYNKGWAGLWLSNEDLAMVGRWILAKLVFPL